MSDFSDAFAASWSAAFQVFGDTCTLNGTDYGCIIHNFRVADEVVPGRPGRTAVVAGTVVMKATDWVAAAGRKGAQIGLPGGTFRVMNDPEPGYSTDTVELQIGPLT